MVPPGMASTRSLITVMPPPRENTPVKAVAPTSTSITMVVVLPASIRVLKQVLRRRSPKIKNSRKAMATPMAEASVAVATPVNSAPSTPRISAIGGSTYLASISSSCPVEVSARSSVGTGGP